MTRSKFFSRFWWKNQLKYQPLAQRAFLFFSLSSRFPAMLNIEPTNLCNLNCLFCPVEKTNRPKSLIDLKFYQKIIDQISRAGKLKVLWLNKDGEPLLHPQIDEMVAYAKKTNVADRVEIYTNGVLLNKPIARKLIKAKLDSLVISLDAVDRESFAQLKGKDAYHRVVENVKGFLKLRLDLGASKPVLSVKIVDLGRPQEVVRFKRLWQNLADFVVVQPLHAWEGSAEVATEDRKRKREKRYPCNLPWLAPAINWEGTVVPCCVNYRNSELVLGDLKKQSLAEIFSGGRFQALRKAHLKGDLGRFPTCAGCDYWRQLPQMSFWLRRIGA